MIVGLCGAQGSGKSTAAVSVADLLEGEGVSVALLSLDDLYFSAARRLELAHQVHPLFRTRGVPGTHDVAQGVAVLAQLAQGRPTPLPRFSKALDEPLDREHWPIATSADIILFEGWCVGASAQSDEDLEAPVNDLERNEDLHAGWRRYVNDALAGPYQQLFAKIDRLVLLAAPDFGVVSRWRKQQEHALRKELEQKGASLDLTMDDEALERFIMHYERLSRHILDEMPGRADLTMRLDPERRVIARIQSRNLRPW